MRKVAIHLACAALLVVACTVSRDASEGEPKVESVELASAPREHGEALMARLQCNACHAASKRALERLRPEKAPDLSRIGARKTPDALREFLLDPRKCKPGSAMPDVMPWLASRERAAMVDELVQFLVTLGGPFDASGTEVDVTEIERGRQLYHKVGCVACHAPQESADDLATPIWQFKLDAALAPNVVADLGAGAFATNVSELAKFLVDPVSVHPAGRMPSCKLESGEARAIAAYLLRGQAGAIEELPGWRCEYFEAHFDSVENDMDGHSPVSGGVITDVSKLPDDHREDHFGYRISGLLAAPATGRYEFATKSDDGSRIYVDEKLVVNNDGDHSPAEKSGEVSLEKGQHAITITMYENAGGEELAVTWRPPNAQKETIPASAMTHWGMKLAPARSKFVADAKAAERGAFAFVQLCASCHAGVTDEAPPSNEPHLDALAAHADRGCLADAAKGRAPRFDLDATQRASLRTLVANASALDQPRSPHEQLDAMLARFDCLACHARDGAGGPAPERVAYFKEAVEVDLGNEGRLPPKLGGIGGKLYGEAIARVLIDGEVERPYIATRMPQFGAENVKDIVELFEQVDGKPSDLEVPPPMAGATELGRKLAGTGGLGCIQCHSFDGVKSLGIPAADLAHVKDRIKPAWFRQLLLDPKSLGMNTRMPVFFDSNGVSAAKHILDGDPKKQAEALWAYVSLGRSMPLPDGLVVPDSEYELTPTTEPILCGVFMRDASPRCILVGTPELVHYAFDVENSRLVCAWRGRFFNAKGTWNGRAGSLEWPKSDDVLEFPKLAPVAILAKPDDPWPTDFGRDAGFKRLGTRFDHGLPVFRYKFHGIDIEEEMSPCVLADRQGLRRSFNLRSATELKNVFITADVPPVLDSESSERRRRGHAGSIRSAPKFEEASSPDYRERVVWAKDGADFMAHFEIDLLW